jgi:hypothetical protein
MRITVDPSKRRATPADRGRDFRDAAWVFGGPTLEVEDRRSDHGEIRIVCLVYLAGRLVVPGCTPRGSARHVLSMRKADAREKARVVPLLAV